MISSPSDRDQSPTTAAASFRQRALLRGASSSCRRQPDPRREVPVTRFSGVDLLELDALLTDDERLVRDTVRAFVDDQVKPIIEECHREGRTPLHLVPQMGALNLFGANLHDYGLPGLGAVAYGL